MLDFCSALDQFLKSARKSHFEIEQVVQQCEIETVPEGGNRYTRISEKLKSLKADAHHYVSANNLLEKIQAFQLKHREFLKKLKLEYEKLGNKERSARAWRKAVNMIFITTVAAECVTAAATLAVRRLSTCCNGYWCNYCTNNSGTRLGSLFDRTIRKTSGK
ncbi:hypothetical protein M0R45_008027 [Rubus argutus]|uniref:Uncharacterized protein n=1 Tax=Rubus argutus TaxID=59490 RepID=A0AAW1XZZ7_RUBAR